MEDTIFAKIVRREVPAEIVYEDADTLAFLDIHPNNPGHTLVIPKKPFRNILDIDDETLCLVWKTARKVARAVQEATRAEGLNINTNNEEAAGQLVMHYHVHIIPRFLGDGYKLWHGKDYAPGEKEKIASAIRAKLS